MTAKPVLSKTVTVGRALAVKNLREGDCTAGNNEFALTVEWGSIVCCVSLMGERLSNPPAPPPPPPIQRQQRKSVRAKWRGVHGLREQKNSLTRWFAKILKGKNNPHKLIGPNQDPIVRDSFPKHFKTIETLTDIRVECLGSQTGRSKTSLPGKMKLFSSEFTLTNGSSTRPTMIVDVHVSKN